MKILKIFTAFTIALLWGVQSHSATMERQESAGIRFAAQFAQDVMAAPPLPSLDQDEDSHFSLQGTWGSGQIAGFYDEANGYGYAGSPAGYGLGMGYTSSSMGAVSYFIFGMYAQAKADIDLTKTPIANDAMNLMWSIHDSEISTGGLGAGLNFVLLGSHESPLALGAFAGGMGFLIDTKYKFSQTSNGISDSVDIASKAKNYGPLGGVQMKLRFGRWLSLIPYGMYFYDSTDHCVAFSESLVAAPGDCAARLNTSFYAAGLAISIMNFRFTAYTKTFTELANDDTKLTLYRASYTFDF